jgi:hypothetical protein
MNPRGATDRVFTDVEMTLGDPFGLAFPEKSSSNARLREVPAQYRASVRESLPHLLAVLLEFKATLIPLRTGKTSQSDHPWSYFVTVG